MPCNRKPKAFGQVIGTEQCGVPQELTKSSSHSQNCFSSGRVNRRALCRSPCRRHGVRCRAATESQRLSAERSGRSCAEFRLFLGGVAAAEIGRSCATHRNGEVLPESRCAPASSTVERLACSEPFRLRSRPRENVRESSWRGNESNGPCHMLIIEEVEYMSALNVL